MTTATKAKWLRFLVLVLGGGTIYKLANLKDAFYVPMQEAMGLTHTEIGALLSINAIVATALFIVGGFLADRFDPRRLIPVGLIGSGALGLYMATFPGFSQMMVVFALLAICADCFFFPSLLKAVRTLGDDGEQGRMFGFLEGGRGVVDTLVAFSALGVFVVTGAGAGGLKAAILFYSAVNIGAGLLCWFLLRDTGRAAATQAPVGVSGLLEAVRVPGIWLVSLNVFMVYIVYCGLTYFIPYLKDMYGLPVALVGAYGIINQYFLKVLGGPAGGFLADRKFGSSSRYLKWAFLALLPVMAIVVGAADGPGLHLPGNGGDALLRLHSLHHARRLLGADERGRRARAHHRLGFRHRLPDRLCAGHVRLHGLRLDPRPLPRRAGLHLRLLPDERPCRGRLPGLEPAAPIGPGRDACHRKARPVAGLTRRQAGGCRRAAAARSIPTAKPCRDLLAGPRLARFRGRNAWYWAEHTDCREPWCRKGARHAAIADPHQFLASPARHPRPVLWRFGSIAIVALGKCWRPFRNPDGRLATSSLQISLTNDRFSIPFFSVSLRRSGWPLSARAFAEAVVSSCALAVKRSS